MTIGNKVIVISDLHLGMKDSSPKKILKFLNSISCELLILNGDIIDIDAIKRGSKWKNKHTKVVLKLIEMSKEMDIIYVRGNHDDDIKELYGFIIGNIKIVDEYILNVFNKNYLIFHGDKIDATVKYKLLSQIGSIGYDISLRLNTWYNKYRTYVGKPYFSISKLIKEQFKSAIKFILDFESNSCDYAKTQKCDGVICGHIHIPTIKKIDNILYLNSGDWVENFSYLSLSSDNKWSLNYFDVE
jgi:UDP-2,3-diacylglucosamine pyrophosphatase LpxH